jgi:quercetin dioxygenase-like cupin family protein
MPNTAAEPIQVGALAVRFHVDADESGGSVSVFECDVPANARMPAPHSHDDFDETVFGLEGVTTFTVGGGRTDLKPGEALFIPRRVIHGFSNGGDVSSQSSVRVCWARATSGMSPTSLLAMVRRTSK